MIGKCSDQCFNSDPKKPAQEVTFSRKKQSQSHTTRSLNNIHVERASYQKHLGIILDEKRNFKQHIDNAILKFDKGISVIKKLRHGLPRKSLITIYKTFLRPLIDYGDIIYDQPQNESFCEKLESVQYKAALAITGAIQDASREKIYLELGLESLKNRRWYKRLCCMFKIINEETPKYLTNLTPKGQQTIVTRNSSIPTFYCRTDCFKYSFFPSTLKDWFNLGASIRNSESIAIFKSRSLSLIRPSQSNVYNIFDPIGLKLLTRLRLDFSHLNEHKSRHNFQDVLNPLCLCSLEIEDTIHYLLHCQYFFEHRINLINSVRSVSENFESFSDNGKRDILLHGDPRLDANKNKLILE